MRSWTNDRPGRFPRIEAICEWAIVVPAQFFAGMLLFNALMRLGAFVVGVMFPVITPFAWLVITVPGFCVALLFTLSALEAIRDRATRAAVGVAAVLGSMGLWTGWALYVVST